MHAEVAETPEEEIAEYVASDDMAETINADTAEEHASADDRSVVDDNTNNER
jgi:hypothetical protein